MNALPQEKRKRVLFAFYGGMLSETVVEVELNDESSGNANVAAQCYQATGGRVGSRFWVGPNNHLERPVMTTAHLDPSDEVKRPTSFAGHAKRGRSMATSQQYEIIERIEQDDTLVVIAECSSCEFEVDE